MFLAEFTPFVEYSRALPCLVLSCLARTMLCTGAHETPVTDQVHMTFLER